MATKKTTSKTPIQMLKKTILLYKNLSIIIGIVLVASMAYGGYSLTIDYLDKKRFDALAESMKALQSKLQAEAGGEVGWRYEESCIGERRVKFEVLTPRCSVALNPSTLINVADIDEADEFAKSYDSLVTSEAGFELKSNGRPEIKSFVDTRLLSDGNRSVMRELNHQDTGIYCMAGYSLSRSDELRISMWCSDNARKEWY